MQDAHKSATPGRRLFWLLACSILGLGIGLLGNLFTSDPRWFLALPVALATGWLFFANPEACLASRHNTTMHEDASLKHHLALTIYCARTGDHNARAMDGALALGRALARRLGIPATTLGQPAPPRHHGWREDLADAMPALLELAAHLDGRLASGLAPLLVLNRCAAALATLPVVVRHRPDACIVWFDAHGDLNSPDTSPSGYLGGMALAGPAGLWNTGLGNGLALGNIILVGARDLDPAERELIDSGMVKQIAPGKGSTQALHDALAGRPAYIHLDCDVLAPGIVPTDYRVPGGLALQELHGLCEVLAKGEIIGLEIAEFENAWTDGGPPAVPDALLDALWPAISGLGRAD